MNNSFKRFIAIFLAFAMVLSTIAVQETYDVDAAPVVTASIDGKEYTVTLKDSTITGFDCQGFYDSQRIHFAWSMVVDPATIAVTVNGNAVTANGTSVNGMFIYVADIASLEIGGEYDMIVTATETTNSTEVVANLTIKVEQADERDPSLTYWKEIVGDTSYLYDDSTTASVVSVQQPAWAKETGVYISVSAGISSVSVNGVTEGVCTLDGAGVVVFLSALTKNINEVVITHGQGVATVIIKNTNISESESESESKPEEATTEPESESEETTTEAEPETEGVTVVDGTELLLQTEFATGNVDKWAPGECYNVVYNGDGSVDMILPAYTGGQAYTSQFVQAGITMIKGKWYKARFTISSDVYRTIEFRMQTVGSWVQHNATTVDYVPANGTIDVEVIFQAAEDTDNCQYGIMLGYFEDGSAQEANITISDASLTVYNSQPAPSETVIYPVGPSEVTATADTPLQIDASWVCDSAPVGQTYNIYLDDSATPIATGVTGTSYTITGVAEGDHTVTVEAVVDDKTSVKVTSATVTVYPVPTLTEITSISANGGLLEMVVSWTCPNASGLQTYNIYLNGSETATVTGIKGNAYTLAVAAGTYSVTVKAVIGEEISAGLTVSNVSVLAELPDVLTSDRIAVEGFQIKTNGTEQTGISFRTVCKAPNVGETITVGGATYTIKNMGKIFVLDTNHNGYRKNDTLDTSYTILNPTAVNGAYVGYKDSYRTKGFLATEIGIKNYWNPEDTENSYYVTTMTGMDSLVEYSIHVRAFVVATDAEGNEVLIYGTKTATTSIAQVASHIYSKSLAPNNTAHQYLYSAILNNSTVLSTTNPYYRTTTLVYGWDNILYVPDEKALLDAGTLEELNKETN